MLEAINLCKLYDAKPALVNLSLSVTPGEIFCLLGQNGAGKTTTINLFLGLVKASSGKALVDGVEIHSNSPASSKVAYIPEVVQLYGNLNGIENLRFFSRLAGHRYSQKELQKWLIQAGLQEDAHFTKLSSYSKGMRQKVGIAIAISKNAKVIFMDEPTSGLDPQATNEFSTICKGLAEQGTCIFMATHDIFNAVHVGTRIGIMKAGQLIASTPTQNITATELQQLYLKSI